MCAHELRLLSPLLLFIKYVCSARLCDAKVVACSGAKDTRPKLALSALSCVSRASFVVGAAI